MKPLQPAQTAPCPIHSPLFGEWVGHLKTQPSESGFPGRTTNAPCSIHSPFLLRMGGTPQNPTIRIGFSRTHHNRTVPHSFAFFIANGWDTSKPNHPNRVFPDAPQPHRAPFIRPFSGEWVGHLKTQPSESGFPGRTTTAPCPIHSPFFWRMGGTPQNPTIRIGFSRTHHKCTVLHSFAFFLANGWDTSKPNHPNRVFPDAPQPHRAPFIRLFSGEWVGHHKPPPDRLSRNLRWSRSPSTRQIRVML
jgi:hypothetical protein